MQRTESLGSPVHLPELPGSGSHGGILRSARRSPHQPAEERQAAGDDGDAGVRGGLLLAAVGPRAATRRGLRHPAEHPSAPPRPRLPGDGGAQVGVLPHLRQVPAADQQGHPHAARPHPGAAGAEPRPAPLHLRDGRPQQLRLPAQERRAVRLPARPVEVHGGWCFVPRYW